MINKSCREGSHCQCEEASGRCCWCDDPATICPPIPPKDLKNISIDDMKREIARREKREFDKKNTPPTMSDSPDFASVIDLVNSNIDQMRVEGYADEDFAQYVFEQVIRSLYPNNSKEFWNWWNWRRNG